MISYHLQNMNMNSRRLVQLYAAMILDDLQEKARSHKSGHSYGLEEYGLTEEAIRAAVPTVFERYEFD